MRRAPALPSLRAPLALATIAVLAAGCAARVEASTPDAARASFDAARTPTVAIANAAPTLVPPASCARDTDCSWNDPCTPSACVAARPRPPGLNCGRPSVPGDCRCLAGTCTTVRSQYARASALPVACASDTDCAIDRAQGLCVPAAAGAPVASGDGVSCVCDRPNHRCIQVLRGPVRCQSFRDCSLQWVNGHDVSAVPAWWQRRTVARPVRPCRDGEHDSVCRARTCRVVHWGC